MSRGALLLAHCVLVAACADDQTTITTDLGTVVPDLSVGDLAAVPDMTYNIDFAHCAPFTPVDGFASSADAAAGFCDGTTLAGTCAQAFFASFAACYVPAGCRVYLRNANTGGSWQYASGASGSWDITDISGYGMNGHPCATVDGNNAARDDHWTLADGTKLTINWTSGNVTCPDGSTIQIANPASCDALNALINTLHKSDPGCCLP
jgi:hypothetical protein